MKKVKVWSIWIDPVRDGFARKFMSNIPTRKKLITLMKKVKKENPGRRFFSDSELKTTKQIRFQKAFAKAMKGLK